MKIVLLFIIFSTISCQAMIEMDFSKLAEHKPENEIEKLRISINKYLIKYSTDKEFKKFDNKIKDAIEEADKYGGISTEQTVLDKKFIDWYSDHKSEFSDQKFKQKTLVEGCMFLKYIYKHNLRLPKEMEDELDNKDINKLSETLDKEIEKQITLKE